MQPRPTLQFLSPPIWNQGQALHSTLFLPRPGKHQSQCLLTAMSVFGMEELLFVGAANFGCCLLVESGTQRSVLPARWLAFGWPPRTPARIAPPSRPFAPGFGADGCGFFVSAQTVSEHGKLPAVGCGFFCYVPMHRLKSRAFCASQNSGYGGSCWWGFLR